MIKLNGVIKENVKRILNELPQGVQLVAAAKARSVDEVREAVEAGVEIVGENYVQEAEAAFKAIGREVKWHFIGHLQKNKVKRAVTLFDMVETVDSAGLAEEIDRRCRQINKIMPVLIEINSGRESQKFGVFPERGEELIGKIRGLKNIKIMGLMTMGPFSGDPENARPYFIETRKLFDRIKVLDLADGEMRYLSMGMSNSYRVAIEEGANIIRVGSRIFGPRPA